MQNERLYRIGEKLVSMDKVIRLVGQTLELREQGYSQQETANRLLLDRSFVSRLETVGEIRKGNRLAVIGFPLQNADSITALCREYGLEFHLILNNSERWDMVQDQQALDFFNRILELVARLRQFDVLIMITSEKWYQLADALLDIEIIHLGLGPSPIDEDRHFDQKRLEDTLKQVIKQR